MPCMACIESLGKVWSVMATNKKKISKSDIIGQQGIALIHQMVSAMGFLWHPTGLEAGIDGLIELRDAQTSVVTGHFVPVQSKAADNNADH